MENFNTNGIQIPEPDFCFPEDDAAFFMGCSGVEQQDVAFDEINAQGASMLPSQAPLPTVMADRPRPLDGDEKAVLLYNQVIAHAEFLISESDAVKYVKYTNKVVDLVPLDGDACVDLLIDIGVTELGKPYKPEMAKTVRELLRPLFKRYAVCTTVGTRIIYHNNSLYYHLYDNVALCISGGKFYNYDTSNTDIHFLHRSSAKPQIMPDFSSPAEALPALVERAFNVSPQNRLKFIAQLCCFFLPHINVPILVLSGGQGTAKSTTAKKIVSLVDPALVDVSYVPEKQDGLTALLSSRYLTALDNVENISNSFSNLLCIACTGGYDSKRMLYKDNTVIDTPLRSHVIMNGIGDYVKRPDLAERSNVIYHTQLRRRMTERMVWQEFEQLKPTLLGSLFNTLRIGMTLVDEMSRRITELPRMADFAIYGAAFIQACGLDPLMFIREYTDSNNDFVGDCAEQDEFYSLIKDFVREQKGTWTGSATALLEELKKHAANMHVTFAKTSNAALSRRLRSSKPVLLKMGVVTDFNDSVPKSITLQLVDKNVTM